MAIKKTATRTAARRHRRIAPLEQRAYYTRSEFCATFGLSSKRLKEAIDKDDTLPMVQNGRNQLFPKAASHVWYEAQAANRVNVHAS